MPDAGARRGPPATSVSDVLRVLGVGVNHAILRGLGEGPLRSEELTHGFTHYAERTVERHLPELIGLAAIAQHRDVHSVPPAVTYELTRRAGRGLLGIIATDPLPAGPDSDLRAETEAAAKFKLLAAAWSTEIVEHLSCEPRRHSELDDEIATLTHHQLGRLLRRLAAARLLATVPSSEGHRCYRPTDKMRREVALTISAVGRWHRRHVRGEEAGLTVPEMASILRCALPLVRLSDRPNEALNLTVVGEGRQSVSLWARIDGDGVLHCGRGEGEAPSASVSGTVATWIALLLEDKRGRVRVGGDGSLVDACADALQQRLHEPGP